MTTFQTTIRALRKECKLSQKGVADGIGIKFSTYQAWEEGRGKAKYPELITLARFYDVTVDYLLTGKNAVNFSQPKPIVVNYLKAPQKIKKAVEMLLNL